MIASRRCVNAELRRVFSSDMRRRLRAERHQQRERLRRLSGCYRSLAEIAARLKPADGAT